MPDEILALAIAPAGAYPGTIQPTLNEDSMAKAPKRANVKKATAILITCLVEAMSDLDADFKDRFVKNLDRSYAKIRDDTDDLNALELLSWTRTMVTGFDFSGGQQRPFLD